MQTQAPGFLRPVQSAALSGDEERNITTACPGLGQNVIAAGRQDDPLWGPYLTMQTGHATDPSIRFAGASGGALSMILAHLVTDKVVDAVIQITAAADPVTGNQTVITTDRAGITQAAGSRYAPSAPLSDLPTQLADHPDKRFAFVGKPCDVAALRAMQERDETLKTRIPVLVSFFCAGVPSLTGAEAVLAALDTDLSTTAAFRYRGNGWPGQATATLHDGTTRTMSYHDSWGKILSKHVQHRCKICADGTGVAADIVCADAWESDADGYPLFAEQPGTSLIVARTALGAQLVQAAKIMGRIETSPFDVKTLTAIQPGQRERRRALRARLIGRRLAGKPIPQYRGLQLRKAAQQNPMMRNLKNLLGMIRRSLKA
jgi:coenzyme F420 hydrogenase subunit beta